ncbi:uncharacterized protein LOC120700545 [Panicum virgatum]|uniref:uncharacterized protein LOC120700545 n=1 Tax=Panicum virgatum TaxID=38727 RepID=UPI0019D5F219|nr:uncharacterized protein LOC120700545 [Panicum virgatum]
MVGGYNRKRVMMVMIHPICNSISRNQKKPSESLSSLANATVPCIAQVMESVATRQLWTSLPLPSPTAPPLFRHRLALLELHPVARTTKLAAEVEDAARPPPPAQQRAEGAAAARLGSSASPAGSFSPAAVQPGGEAAAASGPRSPRSPRPCGSGLLDAQGACHPWPLRAGAACVYGAGVGGRAVEPAQPCGSSGRPLTSDEAILPRFRCSQPPLKETKTAGARNTLLFGIHVRHYHVVSCKTAEQKAVDIIRACRIPIRTKPGRFDKDDTTDVSSGVMGEFPQCPTMSTLSSCRAV